MRTTLSVIGVLLISVLCFGAEREIEIEVVADHSLADLSTLSFKSFNVECKCNSIHDEIEESIVDIFKLRLSEKGLEYSEKDPDVVLFVLVQDLKHQKYMDSYLIDDSDEWPSIVYGNSKLLQNENEDDVDSKVTIYESTEEMPPGYIQIFLVMNPHRDNPKGMVWWATASCKDPGAEMLDLAVSMAESMMLEYPTKSELPKARIVNISDD